MKIRLLAPGRPAEAHDHSPAPSLDPRAERYFATAARYNAAATDLGYLSLEHAVRAGRMADILRRVAAGG